MGFALPSRQMITPAGAAGSGQPSPNPIRPGRPRTVVVVLIVVACLLAHRQLSSLPPSKLDLDLRSPVPCSAQQSQAQCSGPCSRQFDGGDCSPWRLRGATTRLERPAAECWPRSLASGRQAPPSLPPRCTVGQPKYAAVVRRQANRDAPQRTYASEYIGFVILLVGYVFVRPPWPCLEVPPLRASMDTDAQLTAGCDSCNSSSSRSIACFPSMTCASRSPMPRSSGYLSVSPASSSPL